VEGYFTFDPVGRGLKGFGGAALDMWLALPRAGVGLYKLGSDAVGYAGNAISPRRSVLTGEAFPYQPESGLIQSIQKNGLAGTIGLGITGAVRGAPGIGLIGALGAPQRDWNAVGAQVFNTAATGAGAAIGVGRVATSTDDFVTFYHGTSPQNAANIRLTGIDLSKSKAINDFGPGFYMTTSREEAIRSATMMSKSAQDVVEFSVPRSELANLNGKVFKGADAEWADFVTMNRKLDTAPYLPPDEWGYTFDMVTGPMFGGVKKGGIRTLSGRGDQTSIHTQGSVDLFNRYMQGR
jgi:hypothetical protein